MCWQEVSAPLGNQVTAFGCGGTFAAPPQVTPESIRDPTLLSIKITFLDDLYKYPSLMISHLYSVFYLLQQPYSPPYTFCHDSAR